MLDPAIVGFLSERIVRRVDSKCKEFLKINTELSVADKSKIECAARDEYNVKNWLLFCAKNAHGVSMTTHPCKFSHPDAKTSSIYFNDKVQNKGYLLSGYSNDTDVIFSTAAYMPIYSFLKIELADGRELLDHLLNNTDVIQKQFSDIENFEQIRTQLLEVISSNTDVETSEKVKQVYFPIDDDYHLLSVVSASVIMFDFKKRIKKINSYEINKPFIDAKKNNQFIDGGFKNIFGLTVQGHVKSNPQCISQLNKNNFGESYLLNSSPPSVEKRDVHFPKSDFFVESFKQYEYANIFKALHKLFQADHNNISIRDARDSYLQQVIDLIIEKMWAVRAISQDHFHEQSSNLSSHQRTWLRSELAEQRENETQWLDTLVHEISRWFSRRYEKVLGKQAIKLGEEERLLFANYVEKNKEFLI